MQDKVLNICLHDIVADIDEVKTIYDITLRQLDNIVKSLQKFRTEKIIDSYKIFFDDGYKSALDVVNSVDLGISKADVHLAIITDDIGKSNKLTESDITLLSQKEHSIDSHGVSHAALAVFNDELLQISPSNGVYKNMPYGKSNVLSDKEIAYQLIESSKRLASITGSLPTAFVLPYGLYNQEVVYQAVQSGYYRIYTCDAALDTGQFLAPRLLVTQENIEKFTELVLNLSTYPKYLI